MKKIKIGIFIITSILAFSACNKNTKVPNVNENTQAPVTSENTQTNNEKENDEAKSLEDKKIKMLDFTLQNNNGEDVSYSDYEGKILVLNFWASWCPYCVDEMADFQKLYDENNIENSEVVILMLNQTDGHRETKEVADKFMVDHKLSMPFLYDTGEVGQNIFGFPGLPATIIIDKEGYIVDYTAGKTSYKVINDKIEKIKSVKE